MSTHRLAPYVLLLAACGGPAGGSPPERTSPALTPLPGEVDPSAVDTRSGAFVDARTNVVRRVQGDALVDLTTTVPTSFSLGRVFADGTVLGVGSEGLHFYETASSSWTAILPTACDATATSRMVFGVPDGASRSDVWAVLRDLDGVRSQLCHFDGAAWTAEPIDPDANNVHFSDSVYVTFVDCPAADPCTTTIGRRTGAGTYDMLALPAEPLDIVALDTGIAFRDASGMIDIVSADGSVERIAVPANSAAVVGGARTELFAIAGELGGPAGGGGCFYDPLTGTFPCAGSPAAWSQFVVSRYDGTAFQEIGHVDFDYGVLATEGVGIGGGRLLFVSSSDFSPFLTP
jgi:hypothetical protein